MKFSRYSLNALVLVTLALAMQAGNAQTQPTVTSTFDVCEDAVSGKWRYSGMVSVLGKADSQAAVEYRVQNAVSNAGYSDVLQLPKVPGTEQGIVNPASGATVYLFAGEAPALTLGTLRNAASVQLFDRTVAGGSATAIGEPYTAQVCGCPVVGCTRTQGYWSSKPGVVWPAPRDRQAWFYSSGLTWQALFDQPTRGNAYIILAHQFMAAALTKATGASMPPGVQSAYYGAAAWFASGTALATCAQGSSCAKQKTWAATLDTFNNGDYPGGPRHCAD